MDKKIGTQMSLSKLGLSRSGEGRKEIEAMRGTPQ